MTHVFISYSKADRDFVVYLRALLESEGFEVWFDDELHPGDGWWHVITESISEAGAVIVVMSTNSLGSKWVEREILFAENNNKPIFPVLLSGDVWSRLADIQFEDVRAGLHAKLSQRFLKSLQSIVSPLKADKIIDFNIVNASIIAYPADVAVFKYAQKFHGADHIAASILINHGNVPEAMLMPEIGQFNFHDLSDNDLKDYIEANSVLYIGTPRIKEMTYAHLRDFGHDALAMPAGISHDIQSIIMTIHGPGFGLDENEALISQFAGIIDALEAGTYPTALERVTIVEYSPKRSERLRATLDETLINTPYAAKNTRGEWGYRLHTGSIQNAQNSLATAGKTGKRNAYVALSADDTQVNDLFYYGIQKPVHALGLLCEHYESAIDTNDVLEQVKARIESASVVIADVSHPDPLVYLQLGYAWGNKRPVVLIARGNSENLFDGTPCLTYNSIRELETVLFSALQEIIA